MNPYDVDALLGFRERLAALAGEGPPRLEPAGAPAEPRRLAILSGSFNPPTSAHVLLAERALAADFDAVAYVLPVAPAGKAPGGLCPEDRLLALSAIAEPPAFVAVSSAPLYAEQAVAAARAFPRAEEIAFLVGSDKLAQIFDASWYPDRDAALQSLFERASLMVTPRGDGHDGVAALIDRPDNRRFAERIALMPLHPAVCDVSSTRVRGLLASGADSSGLLPEPVRALCAETRAFERFDADRSADWYGLRVMALDLLWRRRDAATPDAFRAMIAAARAPGPSGARMRALLQAGDGAAVDAALHAAG